MVSTLEPAYDKLLSNIAFNCNLRPSNLEKAVRNKLYKKFHERINAYWVLTHPAQDVDPPTTITQLRTAGAIVAKADGFDMFKEVNKFVEAELARNLSRA